MHHHKPPVKIGLNASEVAISTLRTRYSPDDELLKQGETVNGHRYRQQLINLNHALFENGQNGKRDTND
ncbi:hypothetical protein CEXT_204881 [Caerostris extrusa]|uniref:Uncharacterized protein n=1 Tax=Caerostris extrusa TaxID=172846 RepID=A0AAV4XK25_CAEEX|nr:hypothetical protein CEXT_204881 [Caerostris extrusa]